MRQMPAIVPLLVPGLRSGQEPVPAPAPQEALPPKLAGLATTPLVSMAGQEPVPTPVPLETPGPAPPEALLAVLAGPSATFIAPGM